MERLTGQTLGQYELRSLLGMGGMGAVYEGYQPSLQRSVAVKVLFATANGQLGNYEERFTREARMSAMLEHPHIVPVYDYGIERDISYVVMRLLKGGTLAERLENGGSSPAYLPLDEVIQITDALASALFYAHKQGVIHRDIKAKNVMFDEHGTVMLVDFGLAKLVGNTTSLTLTGKFAGTPEYMAPEQWRGDSTTPAIDQYALAILVYEMLIGHRVFEGDSHYELMHKHTQESPSLTDGWRDELPEALVPVLSRALRKDPKTRYPNVKMFAQALSQAARAESKPEDAGVLAPAPPVADNQYQTVILPAEPDMIRAPRRIPRWLVGAMVALIAGIVGTFALAPGLAGGVSATNDTPGPTVQLGQNTSESITEIPAGIESTRDPTATSTSSPTETATKTPLPTDTMTPTALPTDTTTPTPLPTDTMTATIAPASTSTAIPTATSQQVAIAQIICDQMDVNQDGIVDILDLRVVAAVFGSKRGDATYHPEYDYDNNWVIDEADLQSVVSQYDRRCS